uniref:Poly(A) RNA polymerase mitochondrial-like central palm domain-containing protein n=1 Tax=Bracon brevicornis TaxID=1563983 RepID=A0A6V7K6U8_9HYME
MRIHFFKKNFQHFFLIEFKSIESQKAILETATHVNHHETIPTFSNMLWFRNSLKKQKKLVADRIPPISIAIDDQKNETKCLAALQKINSISEQMETLYNFYRIDETSIRLRFLTAQQFERTFSGLFPNNTVLPFGSTVNSFGKRGCDLDLVMTLDGGDTREKLTSRLVYQTKSTLPDERAQTKRSMEVVAQIMQTFMPGIRQVRKILNARVPIIKYDHSLTGIECDLSMTNL